MSNFSDYTKRWEAWGIPAAIGVLAPWYEKVIAFPLISPYWQPELNTICMVVGALSAIITFAQFHRHPREGAKIWLFRVLVLLAVLLFACLVLKLTVGIAYFPSANYQWIVWSGWILAYIGLFASFSSTLVLALMLLPVPPKGP